MTSLEAQRLRERPDAGWTVEDSAALYRTGDWSGGYFAINDRGRVVARGADGEIDIYEVVEGLRERGIHTPVLIRFSDILEHRVRSLHDAFEEAIRENHYTGRYRAVYPIKVNQQHLVVEEIVNSGEPFGFGLEVGSKPELLAVMAMPGESPDRLIICNGFKDRAYIEAVTLARKLGRRIIPVVENIREVRLIIEQARRYDVPLEIGIRVKLASPGSGRWKESSGSRSKFGLFIAEILQVVEHLRAEGMLENLKLLHCHSGSQIQDIRQVQAVINELAQVYVQLKKHGAPLEFLDVGGGLGVDYQGLHANTESSMNYTLQEYAADVVYRIASVCNHAGIDHPTIITECGRAMSAHSSVLVVNTLGRTGVREIAGPVEVPEGQETPQPIRDLRDALGIVSEDRLSECYHDATHAYEAACSLFSLGYMSLEMRALADKLFWEVCQRVDAVARSMEEPPAELVGLDQILSDIYFCNFSLFQSVPDSWAIDQRFPIMPIHRLREEPTRHAVLGDITCDSDGKIDHFIGEEDPRVLPVHDWDGREYYLGVFLLGAYQETLGDLHNLFGDSHAVHVRMIEGRWAIEEVVRGDTTREVLGYMQYDAEGLYRRLQRDCERAVRAGAMTAQETNTLMRFYENGLNSYTYLE